ncbi:MAG: metallophosphoesterase, partial [Gammaproteobacteria bacterium]|nr:metallophosphoesterase [Gammaproteobacteria bacterium]
MRAIPLRLVAAAVVSTTLLLVPYRGMSADSVSEPPQFSVPAPASGGPLTFVVYGDTRFSQHEGIANPLARQALVARIAAENPAAILVGGDLVYEGSDPDDYQAYRNETRAWGEKKIPVFPALGNHELQHCAADEPQPCLENWWQALDPLPLRSFRWYSVTIGERLLALLVDSTSPLKKGSAQRLWLEHAIADAAPGIRFIVIVMHYPPVRDPFYPSVKDEKEVERYLSANAA